LAGLFAWLVSFVLRGLGIGGGPKPTIDQTVEADDGRKSATVESLEAENAQLKEAASSGAAADAGVVRSDGTAGTVNTDPRAPVNNLPDENFRD